MNSSDSVNLKASTEWARNFGAQIHIVHIVYLALLALVADYVWMLYMRWRMVRSFPSHHQPALTQAKPPGPFPWPICGNTFSLPHHKPWYYFEQLSKDFNSPVITFWVGRFVTSTHPLSPHPLKSTDDLVSGSTMHGQQTRF
jgi:hypothetical protein